MGKSTPASPRFRVTMLNQLAISLTATIAATLILTGAQHEIAIYGPATPELTSGGKFAARVESLRNAPDTMAAIAPAPTLPLLVADVASRDVPLQSITPEVAPARASGEPLRPSRRAAHAEPRHRVADAGVDVLPPRRADSLAMETASSVAVPSLDAVADGGIWRTTKGLYHQALWLGGTVLDHMNPANLLP